MFSFALGKEGNLKVDNFTVEHKQSENIGRMSKDNYSIALCQRGRDYSIDTKSTDKEKCEKMMTLCSTYPVNQIKQKTDIKQVGYYDIFLLDCEFDKEKTDVYKTFVSFNISLKNGNGYNSELPITQIMSPEMHMIEVFVYLTITVSYYIYLHLMWSSGMRRITSRIKSIHIILFIVSFSLVLQHFLSYKHYSYFERYGIPSTSLFVMSNFFIGLVDTVIVSLLSIITMGYLIVFKNLFSRQTIGFMTFLFMFFVVSVTSYVLMDLQFITTVMTFFFIIPTIGRFVVINRQILTLRILINDIDIPNVDSFNKKMKVCH